MTGNALPGRPHDEQDARPLEGARRAGDIVAEAKLTAIVEPLTPRVRLSLDLYHQQVQQGNVIPTLTEAAPQVAVFHVADNAGRNDPDSGEMHYPNIYKAISKTGFAGYLMMEYLPLGGDQVASLSTAIDGFRSVPAA